MSVSLPVVAVVFGSVSPPQGDVAELLVHLGCSKEVSSYELRLANFDGKYSASGAMPITVGLDGSISIGRGANCPLLITCRVESVDFQSSPTERYLTVSGRCLGERLFRRVVTKTCVSMKGEAIVKDLMDNYAGLSHVRSGTETVEETDTTYSKLAYTDSPVWDILKYIAESADKSGIIGFDFRVAPDGKFEFFPKNSKTNPVSLDEKIEASQYRKDISRVRNKITIYGEADKSVPADKDAWTAILEPVDGVWVATAGEVAQDDEVKARGTSSIKCYASNNYYGSILFTLNSGKEVNCDLYPVLAFLEVLEKTFSGQVMVSLFDAADRVASKNCTISADEEWHATQLRVGVANEGDWEIVEAGFDWTHVKRFRVSCFFAVVGTGSFWVDGLYFGGRRYAAVREDAASQAAYGLREYVETDEELWSDNECDLRARALLGYLKDAAEYLTARSSVIDYGTTPLLAGDKVQVVLSNENVDSDFRIESVEYHVLTDEQLLELTIELGKVPPQIADYLYGLRTFTVNVEKLARTKSGNKGIPIVIQGGGGMVAYHGDISANQVTSGGYTEDVAVAKDGGGIRTLHFVNSKYTGFTDSE